MPPFQYRRPATLDEAATLLQQPGAQPLGGGTDLLPLQRDALAAPEVIVDLRRLPRSAGVEWLADGGLQIGASARLAHLARDSALRSAFPLLAESCAAVGSEALRHMGTLGGNLCQRPRCWYFRHGFGCHKRGGDSCRAAVGENEYHAIFGSGPCVAVHPSDPAVALTALEAVVHVAGSGGTRDIAFADFYARAHLPGERETAIAPGEIVTAVTIPAASRGGVQRYEKVTQRGAFDFALVSLAAIKRTDGEVRLVLGGVASRPWRVTDSIEEDVASGGLSDDDIETLAQRALYDAAPLAHNGYKVDIAAAVLQRAMQALLQGDGAGA
ncbi:MAG: FAD binding domain-containing protein [Gemmatimonadota bacterium]